MDVSAIARFADVPTGVALITVNAHGENTIIIAAGANWRVTPEAISGRMLAMAAGGALVAQLELPLETVAAGLARARDGRTDDHPQRRAVHSRRRAACSSMLIS